MKQKLLKTLALGLLLTGGVNGAWAGDWTLDADVYFRTSLSQSTYSWASGYPKEASSSNTEFAGNLRVGMFVLQKYTVDDLANVKELKVVLTGANGTDALAFWTFTNDWTKSTAVATLASAVNSAVGLNLNTTGTPSGGTSTKLVDGTSTKSGVADGVNACTFTISGDALTALKSAATSNTFTLLITNKTADMTSSSSGDRKFYSSGYTTESYRPRLIVSYNNAVSLTDGATTTNYETLASAMTAAGSATSSDLTLTINHDVNITSRVNAISNKTLNIVAAKDDITLTNTMTNSLSFLANNGNYGTINIGSAAHSMIITNNSTTTNAIIEVSGSDENSAKAIVNLTNVTFKDITSSNASGLIKTNNDKAKVTLTDVTFDGCTASATDAGIIFSNANGMVTLSGDLTFTDCTGHHFRVKGRLEESSFNANQVYTIYNESINLSSSAVIKMNAANRGKYELVNEDRCLVPKGNSNNEELVVSEAYTLTVKEANASTLIIPFETTIPDGVEAFTVTYAGGGYVTATPVETTLAANTPVLMNATGSAEGIKYKFNATTRATSETAASTEGTHTSGALTGVYAETQPGAGSAYILSVKDSKLGFYKTTANSKVAPYHAYLTATAGAPAFLDFDFGGTTAIEDPRTEINAQGVYYNLNGQRVDHPTKGLYIVNGKKVIMK